MKKVQENKRAHKSPSSKSQATGKKTPAKKPAKSRKRSTPQSRATIPLPGKSGDSSSNANHSESSEVSNPSAEELNYPGGLETLLPCKNRKTLPQIQERPGRKCQLVEIVNFAPEIYQTLITHIKTGVSMNVAVEVVGINESTFFSWGWRGKRDFDSNVDSYFSRFYKDVRRAVAHRAAECERSIVESSPLKYLTHGPGRIFNNPWGKDKSKKGDSNAPGALRDSSGHPALPAPDEALEATFSVMPSLSDEDQYDGDQTDEQGLPIGRNQQTPHKNAKASGREGQTLLLSASQEAEAIKVLGGIGQLTISNDGQSIQLSDSLRQALREQSVVDDDE